MNYKTTQLLDSDKIIDTAFQCGLIKRKSYKIDPLQLLISFFTVLSNGSYSLREWASHYSTITNTMISFQAIHKKLNERYLAFIKLLFEQTISSFLPQDVYNRDLLSFFNRVLVEDSTCVKLCDSLLNTFSGNSNGKVSKAISRIQFTFNLKSCQWMLGKVGTYKESDAAFSEDILNRCSPGDLVLRDLGYWKLPVFKQFVTKGIFFLSKLKLGTSFYDSEGNSKDLLSELKKLDKLLITSFDVHLLVGELKVPLRVIGYKLNREQTKKRIDLSKKSRHKGNHLSKTAQYMYSWNIFVTNIPQEQFDIYKLYDLYKLRWYIECMFKNWKSNFKFEKVFSASTGKDRIKPEIMMHLILLFMASVFQPMYNFFNAQLLKKSSLILSPLKFAARVKENILNYLKANTRQIKSNFVNNELKILERYYCYEKRKDRLNMGQLIFNLSP